MSEDMAGPHWDFALKLYGGEGVSPACLVLQDRAGIDVNVLLVALYAAHIGKGVGAAEIAALDVAGEPIRNGVVVPLRTVRRQMKGADFGPATEQARNKVKVAELAAEQLEQAALAAVVTKWANGAVSAEAVVAAAVAHYGRPEDDDIRSAMALIARAAKAMAA